MKISPIAKQTWIVMGVLFNDLSQGMVISFPSIMVPALLDPDFEMKLDLDTASWIASFIGIGAMMGFLTSSVLMELYGRKFTYIFFLISGLVGWLCLYFGMHVPVLIIGRLLGGFSSASSASIGSVVIGEYTNPRDRGMFLNFRIAILCVGNMVVHLLGNFLNWRTVALISLGSATIALFIVITWPESPAWYASVKKFQECERSFYWLRGKSADSIQELKELLRAQKERLSKTPVSKTFSSKIIEFLKKFKRKDFIKPVIIIVLAGGLLESSGAHIFPAYALQIIEQMTGNKSNTFYYTLGLDIIITFSVILSSVLVKYFKRRTLMFVSGLTSLMVLYFISLYLFLASKGIIPKEKTFIPMVLLGVYLIVNNLGCLTVASSLLGEIFPLVHRGSGTCVSCVILSFVLMFGMKITPYLLAGIKVYGTFTLLATLMLILLIAMWFILPETKDRTLQEIEDFFNYGEYSKVETKPTEDVDDV